ncbi:unnamed protein product [Rotaria magnacalcarata]|uniref:Reverse transcriptase domain-containing protein n=1 Tax=Rotaria magnacalcarata TaxID=392030 RepID=A0A819XG61_9BILA|nr:unnamed protein product [Rotaria magnacalcarata]
MLKQNKPFYLLGDLNDNQLRTTNTKSPLKTIIYKNGLKQLIEAPTRVTSTSSTLIDVIITNKRDTVLSLKNAPCSIADHNIITAFINVKKPRRDPITCTYRSMKTYTQERFCSLLTENITALNNISQTDSVDEQVLIFTNIFQSCLDKCSPIVTNTFKRPPAPWLTDEIRSKINERDSLLCKSRQNVSDITAHNTYKNSKKEVIRLVKSAKRQFFRSKLNDKKNDPKATWKIVNEIIPRKQQNQEINSIHQNTQEIANNFNKYLSSIGKNTYNEVKNLEPKSENKNNNLNNANLSDDVCNSLNTKFRPDSITMPELVALINNLKNTNSVGHDDISLKYLKDSGKIMYTYLLIIINTSIQTGVFPKLWKEAIVKPLYKNGDATLPSNFRPISLLPVLSKILEKAVADQLITYLERNNLISNCQYGYRHHLSTELALVKLTEEIYNAVENKEICLLATLDLSKAFDTVNPELLLQKLTEINVETTWFKSYLSDRVQSVKLNNIVSQKEAI